MGRAECRTGRHPWRGTQCVATDMSREYDRVVRASSSPVTNPSPLARLALTPISHPIQGDPQRGLHCALNLRRPCYAFISVGLGAAWHGTVWDDFGCGGRIPCDALTARRDGARRGGRGSHFACSGVLLSCLQIFHGFDLGCRPTHHMLP